MPKKGRGISRFKAAKPKKGELYVLNFCKAFLRHRKAVVVCFVLVALACAVCMPLDLQDASAPSSSKSDDGYLFCMVLDSNVGQIALDEVH